MQEEFDDHNSLLSRLTELVEMRSAQVVGVEGFMSAGKSYTARRLSTDLGAGLIEVDNLCLALLYPDRPRPTEYRPYPDDVDLKELVRRLEGLLETYSLVVVESICLRDVLARAGRAVDVTVYLKCVSRSSGHWHDGIHLEDYKAGRVDWDGLHRDDLEYHSKWCPHQKADLVLVRIVD